MRNAGAVVGVVLFLATASVGASPLGRWVTTWAAAPAPSAEAMGPFPASPHFANQTLRQAMRISVGGAHLRVRLTNEYGAHALTIGAAHVALLDAHGDAQPGTDRVLSFNAQPTARIPAGAPLVSDPVDLAVPDLATLEVSLYLPEETGPCTCHPAAMQSMLVSAEGNFVGQHFPAAQTLPTRAFVAAVEVENAHAAGTIVTFGDSITDGVGSTPDANHRWPDRLAERLAAAHRGPYGIANAGISGNQLLSDGAGQAALVRFDRDVLAVPGAKYVVILEGINDIGLSYGVATGPFADYFRKSKPAKPVTADDLIGAYGQLIARAHSKGLKVIGATLTPYKGALYYAPEGEAIRAAVNKWIRTGGAFDGVIDFDAVMRDPTDPTQIADGLHPGDHLHGTDKGYQAMAGAIALSLFN